MSAEIIDISLDALTETAAQIRRLNDSLTNKLFEIKNQMDHLDNVWSSEAGEAIRLRFTKSAQRFEEYKELTNQYAAFLDKTVSTYSENEALIRSAASAASEFK